MEHLRIAEIGDIRLRLLEVSTSGATPELKIGGLIFHSAIVAENIRLVDEGETTRILIDMALAHPGKSGSFDLIVPLSAQVKSVTFGTAGTRLWSGDDHHYERPRSSM